jgi:signal transduction histidine kinase
MIDRKSRTDEISSSTPPGEEAADGDGSNDVHTVAELSEIVCQAVHDLRNPLTVVVTLTEFMLGEPSTLSTAELTEYLGMIREHSLEMQMQLTALSAQMHAARGC